MLILFYLCFIFIFKLKHRVIAFKPNQLLLVLEKADKINKPPTTATFLKNMICCIWAISAGAAQKLWKTTAATKVNAAKIKATNCVR